MQNGTYPWMTSSSLAQKSWHPGYQASLTDLFLKKNPLHFGTGISQLAAASSYIEKMSPSGEQIPKCHHLDAKDKPYPCDTCQQYLSILRTDGTSSSSSRPSVSTPMSVNTPPERKAMSLAPPLGPSSSHAERPSNNILPNVPPGQQRPRPHPNKQFLCPVCHKLFTQKGNLKTHMMIHTGEKPYACQVCGKSFTQKGNVDTHMKIHTGEREFGCDSCGKRFTQKGNLKTHIRSVHTKEKPFACNICGKSFSQKGNMQTHMRTHNKDDRFPCTMCGKTFSQKGNLKTHMQRHMGQVPSKRNYGPRNLNSGGHRRPLQPGAHLSPFNLQSSSALSHLPSSITSPIAPKALLSKPPLHHPHSEVSNPRGGLNLTYPESHSEGKSPMMSPMPLITSNNLSNNHSQSYHNPSPSPHPSHLSSPSPVDDVGVNRLMQSKSQPPQQDSHPPTPNHHIDISHRPQMHSPPSSNDNRITSPPPISSAGSHVSSSESEGRPFYSAPPTPVPGPFPTATRWLPHERTHYYDTFQHHSGLGSYNTISQHTTPLSRLSLLASGSATHHNLSQHQPDGEKQSHIHESQFHSIGNPDFSQLLD